MFALQLASENASLKKELRKESTSADIKSGELATSRVALEALEKERNALKQENELSNRLMKQYKIEKTHVVTTLLQLTNEIDEVCARHKNRCLCIRYLISRIFFFSTPIRIQ